MKSVQPHSLENISYLEESKKGSEADIMSMSQPRQSEDNNSEDEQPDSQNQNFELQAVN